MASYINIYLNQQAASLISSDYALDWLKDDKIKDLFSKQYESLIWIVFNITSIHTFPNHVLMVLCQAPSVGSGEPTLPGAVEQMQPQFISRFLEGQSGVTIKSVSCGDLFTTCMTGTGHNSISTGTLFPI